MDLFPFFALSDYYAFSPRVLLCGLLDLTVLLCSE